MSDWIETFDQLLASSYYDLINIALFLHFDGNNREKSLNCCVETERSCFSEMKNETVAKT
jgi:hypothetical protein